MESLAQIAKNLDHYDELDAHPLLGNKSEIGQIALALNQSMKRIKQTQQREKTFLQNASHELRTPIAVISSALDIIDRRLVSDKTDLTDPLMHIRQSSHNMKNLTESLLWLSRISTKKESTQKESTTAEVNHKEPKKQQLNTHELAHLVTEIQQQLNYLIEGRAVNLHLTITEEGSIQIEENLLFIVISNLIRNAFEHSFEGDIHVEITTQSISIQDAGIGIENPDKALIRGISSRESFGLGLDIVTQIAAQKGWHFTLENNLGEGCTATLHWKNKTH